MFGGDPVESGFYLTSIGGVASTCSRVVGAVQFGDVAVGVFYHVGACYEVGITESYFPAWGEAEEFFRWFFHEVIAFDEKLFRKRDFSRAGGGVFGVVYCVKFFFFVFGVVCDNNFKWVYNGHYAWGGFVEVFAKAVVEQCDIDGGVGFVDTDDFAEVSNRRWRVAATSESAEGGHSRVIPGRNEVLGDELEEFSFAHYGVGEIQSGEFNLLGMEDADLFEEPVVERAVVFKFECAD